MIKWTPELVKELETLLEAGHTYREIANKMNITYDAVKNAISRYNLASKNNSTKNEKHNYKVILPEVEKYLTSAKKVFDDSFDLYQKIKYKGKFSNIKQTEDLVLLWSDMHTGMVNKSPLTGKITYNIDIQKDELIQLQRGLNRFYNLYKPSYNMETLYIFSLGDQITNDRIYEGQVFEIAETVGNQIIRATNYISDFIRWALTIFPNVVYINICGNHGRSQKEIYDEPVSNNFEYLLGALIKERFSNNRRVKVIIPNEYFYSISIRGHRYLLTHGHNIRGTTLNTIEKAAKEITLLLGQDFHEVITTGHFHSIHKLPIGPDATLLVNGCFIYQDNFAYTKLRKFSAAKQFLFNVSRKSALHNLQEIDLRWNYGK